MSHKSILLVEDNPDDVALTEAAFASLGLAHELVVATAGEEAIDLLLRRAVAMPPALPHLILLDLKLSGIDGFEVLRRIRGDAATALLPVVVLTSSVVESDVLASYRLGANGYVRKSIDFDEFVSSVAQIVGYWLELNQGPTPERSDAADV